MILFKVTQSLVYGWLFLAILFLLLELSTPGLFFFIAFSGGSLVAALLAFCNYPFDIQCVSFLVTSIISFLILRRCFSVIVKGSGNIKTNSYSLAGKSCVVISEIRAPFSGHVKFRGETWPARVEGAKFIAVGEVAHIVRIEGNHLIVNKG